MFRKLIWVTLITIFDDRCHGLDTEDSVVGTTTEITPEFFTEGITLYNVTDTPIDNGMVIRDIREETSINHPYILESGIDASSTATIVFPDNHKNTSENIFYDGEIPPRLNIFNKYQRPYENYYEQKELYNAKPIKTHDDDDDDYLKNFLLTQSYIPVRENVKVEHPSLSSHVLKPFPYTFENHNGHGHWYTNQVKDQIESYSRPTLSHYDEEKSLSYYKSPYKTIHQNVLEHNDHHYYYLNHGDDSDVDGNNGQKDNKYKSSWKKLAHLATALIPIGLILASLTPSVIYINSSTSIESNVMNFSNYEIHRLLQESGIEMSENLQQCKDKILCRLALRGNNNSSASIFEKKLWNLANE
ncbi:hypothetical protein Phum_PHUM603260 [Pediculus humanus corporis]|uniref:Uncharacterized protein n=1 Tax=Pediculus humanus subsp. corporis TaxID=121224 RepID=E0W3D0_PEDHC|nr:uncharacterized protein Phum_PHUM603260 [Pediculus humanus corporis]EEB20136.1 hypothetical protein Phum_PHUM603260 [Pediculus humanus corporis]